MGLRTNNNNNNNANNNKKNKQKQNKNIVVGDKLLSKPIVAVQTLREINLFIYFSYI